MDTQALRTELLSMAAEDLRVRQELARAGALFEGYHPRMREVHERNAARLRAVLEECGWPARSVVGEEAADAAWLILQHSIGNPDLQRLGLSVLEAAAAAWVRWTRTSGANGKPPRRKANDSRTIGTLVNKK